MTTTTPGRAVCQECPWEGPEHERLFEDHIRCPRCRTTEVYVLDRTADDLPALIPFAEQHRNGAPVTDGLGYVSITCACGERCAGAGTLGGARVAHRAHQDAAARLTPAQCRALRLAEQDARGLLPDRVAAKTLTVLEHRGLIEAAPDGGTRISGAGRGTLAEHLARRV
jgi:hypothetical protein